MLHEFIAANRDEIVRRCRAKVTARSVPPPTKSEIDHGVPLFLEQLVDAMQHGLPSSPQIGRTALLHGQELLRQGFTLSQVVHDYGDVCQAITELAAEIDAPISAEDFRMLNGCLDHAVAGAVTEFGREQHEMNMSDAAVRDNERFGFVVHELRNLIHTALVAFEAVKTGSVGVVGSTAAVLQRSLMGASELVANSLAGVRFTRDNQHREPFLVSAFVQELAAGVDLTERNANGITLSVAPVEAGLTIDADRQAVAAAVVNLLQNAFKFSRPGATVTLRAGASAERVIIEVQDECGGLPAGETDELFRPFEQRSANRTGVGLGLAFSRWAVEANGGRIYARNLPGVGCVFAIDLPRATMTALRAS